MGRQVIIIFIVSIVVNGVLNMCPQGWPTFKVEGERESLNKMMQYINREHQRYHALYPEYNIQNVSLSDCMRRESEVLTKSCNIDYLLAHKPTNAKNYNVSTVAASNQVTLWHVGTNKNCRADWENVASTWVQESLATNILNSPSRLCQHAQANAMGCSSTCFRARLKDVHQNAYKEETIILYNCVFGTICKPPYYVKPYLSEKCEDNCMKKPS